ncbi:respiratory chain complex I subunit 1 family protein [Heliophilum fasciatum]|nr:NADH-quinone oxidoreductase subunit H [Heliophilum fasciatum]MCW2278678.1 formate hydrogenlyase subunit 4 [Heliophilum fasciatum]
MELWTGALQAVLALVAAPLLQGWIKWLKAQMQGRHGPSIWQPYRDLFKYSRKGEVISGHTSWIFRAAPVGLLTTTVVAAMLLPSPLVAAALPAMSGAAIGELLLFVYLLAMGRFCLALAGLDAGSSFGGMGSSREMYVAALAEPALILAALVLMIDAGTTNLTAIGETVRQAGWDWWSASHLLAFLALAVLVVAETGRVPVDNPDTHLELTMIHEGMILEYSGPSLALIQLAVWMKQWLLLNVWLQVMVPFGQGWMFAGLFCLLLALVGVGLALVESFFAKVRIFRVPRMMGASLMLGVLALLARFVQ